MATKKKTTNGQRNPSKKKLAGQERQEVRQKRRSHLPADLEVYEGGCQTGKAIDFPLLAVGWLDRLVSFKVEDGAGLPAEFLEKLLALCQPEATVCQRSFGQMCSLCRQVIEPYGRGEVRVLGEEDIFAAPDLIHHYVVAHQYMPPQVFVQAVVQGPEPSSAEHRAFRKLYI